MSNTEQELNLPSQHTRNMFLAHYFIKETSEKNLTIKEFLEQHGKVMLGRRALSLFANEWRALSEAQQQELMQEFERFAHFSLLDWLRLHSNKNWSDESTAYTSPRVPKRIRKSKPKTQTQAPMPAQDDHGLTFSPAIETVQDKNPAQDNHGVALNRIAQALETFNGYYATVHNLLDTGAPAPIEAVAPVQDNKLEEQLDEMKAKWEAVNALLQAEQEQNAKLQAQIEEMDKAHIQYLDDLAHQAKVKEFEDNAKELAQAEQAFYAQEEEAKLAEPCEPSEPCVKSPAKVEKCATGKCTKTDGKKAQDKAKKPNNKLQKQFEKALKKHPDPAVREHLPAFSEKSFFAITQEGMLKGFVVQGENDKAIALAKTPKDQLWVLSYNCANKLKKEHKNSKIVEVSFAVADVKEIKKKEQALWVSAYQEL